MKTGTKLIILLILIPGLTSMVLPLRAQNVANSTEALILHYDSLFWKGYNECDTALCSQFIDKDIEFYHDKGGITLGAKALLLSIKNNLCSNEDFKLRREEVKGTVRVYPLKKGEATYGAIITGEHVFYIYGKNKPEQLDGRANFTHLWLNAGGKWKMHRVLSYDHHDPGSR